jgi:hypothetical protein
MNGGVSFTRWSGPEPSQSSIAQPDYIAFAIFGGINDAFGDHFVNDCGLPGVAKLTARTVKCIADNPGNAVVKDVPVLEDKR